VMPVAELFLSRIVTVIEPTPDVPKLLAAFSVKLTEKAPDVLVAPEKGWTTVPKPETEVAPRATGAAAVAKSEARSVALRPTPPSFLLILKFEFPPSGWMNLPRYRLGSRALPPLLSRRARD